VIKESATGGRHESDPASTIQIDASHSDMVKLTPGHHILPLIARKLHDIVHHKSLARLSLADKNWRPYHGPLHSKGP